MERGGVGHGDPSPWAPKSRQKEAKRRCDSYGQPTLKVLESVSDYLGSDGLADSSWGVGSVPFSRNSLRRGVGDAVLVGIIPRSG